MGDYFDSFHIPNKRQRENFQNIRRFAKKNDAILLYGNHDASYDDRFGQTCSGYSDDLKKTIGGKITRMVEDGTMQLAYQVGDILITHAGITKTYLNNIGYTGEVSVKETLNNVLIHEPKLLQFYSGDTTGYGEHRAQGPLWVRPNALLDDKPDDLRQIVGHTAGLEENEIDGAYFNDRLGKGYFIEIDEEYNIEFKHISSL